MDSISTYTVNPSLMDSRHIDQAAASNHLQYKDKVKILGDEFEKLFVKNFIEKGLESKLENKTNALGFSSKGMSETFVPEVVAESFKGQPIFGISEYFQRLAELNHKDVK